METCFVKQYGFGGYKVLRGDSIQFNGYLWSLVSLSNVGSVDHRVLRDDPFQLYLYPWSLVSLGNMGSANDTQRFFLVHKKE